MLDAAIVALVPLTPIMRAAGAAAQVYRAPLFMADSEYLETSFPSQKQKPNRTRPGCVRSVNEWQANAPGSSYGPMHQDCQSFVTERVVSFAAGILRRKVPKEGGSADLPHQCTNLVGEAAHQSARADQEGQQTCLVFD